MADVMAQHALLFCSIALLSIVIPIGIFIGRNNVRSTRGQLVDDLAKLFSFAKEQGGTPLIVPSSSSSRTSTMRRAIRFPPRAGSSPSSSMSCCPS